MVISKKSAIFVLVLTVPVLRADVGGPTTWHVDDDCSLPGSGTEDNPFCTIERGVNSAEDGDAVLVAPGTYTGQGNRDISLFGKQINLKSSDGPDVTIMDVEGSPSAVHRGFFLVHGETPETVVEGFTIKNGYLIGDTGGSGPAGGGGGAAIYIRDSSPTIRNCILKNNTSATLDAPFIIDGRGGAVYVDGDSDAIIDRCIIRNNVAEKRGGGMMNTSLNNGIVVSNCLVAGNISGAFALGYPGGGMIVGAGDVTNTIVAYNTSSGPGGGIAAVLGETIRNCTIWGNEAEFGGNQVHSSTGPVTIEHSNIQGGSAAIEGGGQINWGPGNIDSDPLFIDADEGNYRVFHGSPCIDAGDNLAVPEGVNIDLDGDPRFLDDPNVPDTGNPDGVNPIVDMGAYEFDPEDCNNNDVPDAEDIASGASEDCNANTFPDECEVDCNDNGVPNDCDIENGTSEDCNENALPDECEVDCNGNGQADDCDVLEGVSSDCNENLLPDECEVDCNANGQPDDCDIAEGFSEDCTGNGLPDECEVDCNENGEADSCDILIGTSLDCNDNGIPDECPGEITGDGPIITQQPMSQEVDPGDFVFFQVAAQGGVLEYQWRKDGLNLSNSEHISGVTSATLLIVDVQPGDAGSYDCVVQDLVTMGCSVSQSAVLTVTCPADFDGSGAVGLPDLLEVIATWGPCPGCPTDLDESGAVGITDLLAVIADWGPC